MRFILILLWSSLMSAYADEIIVKVSDIEVKRGGSIVVFIFAEDGYPKIHNKALLVKKSKTVEKVMEFKFKIDREEIAVKVLHDENGDGKVTKNWTGIIPKDGLGFSNGQKLSITGAPTYKKSKLSREECKNGIEISVKYY